MPLTADRPKCMVELLGVPLLHRQIQALRHAGAREIAVLGGYKASEITGDFDQLIINPDYATTNMVETLFCAQDFMRGADDIVISYGDIVYDEQVLRTLLASEESLATVVDRDWRKSWELRFEDPLDDAETLKLDDQQCVVELGNPPKDFSDIEGQYIGLTLVRSDAIDLLTEFWQSLKSADDPSQSWRNMYMTSFLQGIIDSGVALKAALVDGGWLEVDSVSDLDLYHQLEKSGDLSSFINLAG